MSKGMVMKVFPGANTSRGFYSLYNYIIPQDSTRIFVIKGGPGVGKSTFMKKICANIISRGFRAEWHCCSSDNGSVDGVVFPQLGIAMIDGTAPHIVDPKNPGAVDEIIHLGDYWNEPLLRQSKQDILVINRRVGRLFGIAYFALQEAMAAMNEWKSYISEAQNWPIVNSMFADTWAELMGQIEPRYDRSPVDRHLFAWAISPQGKVNFIDSLMQGVEVLYLVEGKPGSGKSSFIGNFGGRAMEQGVDVEFYHNTLNPDDIDGIILRSQGIALFTAEGPFAWMPDDYQGLLKRIDLSVELNPDVINLYAQEIKDAEARFNQHMARAISHIAQAKEAHDRMETYYVPAMDFAAIEQKRLEIEQRILGYADELAKAASTWGSKI